jgi:hypothetical protein
MAFLGSIGFLLVLLFVRLIWGRVTDKHVGDALENEFLKNWDKSNAPKKTPEQIQQEYKEYLERQKNKPLPFEKKGFDTGDMYTWFVTAVAVLLVIALCVQCSS